MVSEDESPVLTVQERYCIAVAEGQLQTQVFAPSLEEANTNLNHIKACLEEVSLRNLETKKDEYDFRRECVVHSKNDKVNAEKVMRHWEASLARKENALKKLWQKNQQLENSIRKLEAQLHKNDDEDSDALCEVDMEQLKIINLQHNQTIREKNDELFKLKHVTGKTATELNIAKSELAKQLALKKKLAKVFSERTSAQQKTETETLEAEIEKCQKLITKMESAISAADLPQILEYVDRTAREAVLKKEIKNWEHKVKIAQIANRNAQRKYKFAETRLEGEI